MITDLINENGYNNIHWGYVKKIEFSEIILCNFFNELHIWINRLIECIQEDPATTYKQVTAKDIEPYEIRNIEYICALH